MILNKEKADRVLLFSKLLQLNPKGFLTSPLHHPLSLVSLSGDVKVSQ